MSEPLIQIQGVTKVFGPKQDAAMQLLQQGMDKSQIRDKMGANVGVNNATFHIERGELFVIMGLSGSGKSTLLRCLNRLIDPTAGSIVIEGTDILKLSKPDLLRFRQQKMAMVFQQFALFPHRTVEENVAFGLEIQGVAKEERLRVAREQLTSVGLEGYGSQYPDELSGGMQQRVGLARALANNPDILLMDEAFSALDPLIRDDMQNELLNLQSQLKKTIVFITHDLNEALKLGDRIALMKDGEVVQIGTPEEIVSQPANDYVARFVRGVDLTKVLVAEDVMKRPTPLLRAKDGPHVALRILRDAGLSSGFVVDDRRHLQGIVSASHLALAIQDKRNWMADVSTTHVTIVKPSEPLESLFQLVVDSPYPLAVVDDDGILLGLILKSSILETLASQQGGEEVVAETTVG